MSITAMKQALEALEFVCMECDEWTEDHITPAMKSLRQAIEQAEKQEPNCVVIVEVFKKDWRLEYMSLPVGRHKLYAQQYLYTTPQPQREWVGLTDAEIEEFDYDFRDLVMDIEKLLMERNS